MNRLNLRLFSLLLVSVCFVIFSACSNAQNHSDTPADSLSYLALGDSYTIGTGIEENNNWPMQLADTLREHDFTVRHTNVIATNGWTTSDLINGTNEADPDSTYDLVSLLIGVNNQYQGLEEELYKTEFRELIERSIYYAGLDTQRVFVVSIPNYGVTPFASSKGPERIRKEIAHYNAMAIQIASEYGIPFINITPISERAKEDRSLLASDELHPSKEMYSMWISEMLPVVRSILENE